MSTCRLEKGCLCTGSIHQAASDWKRRAEVRKEEGNEVGSRLQGPSACTLVGSVHLKYGSPSTSPQQPHDVTCISLILRVQKAEHRRWEWLAQSHAAGRRQGTSWLQSGAKVSSFCSSHSPTLEGDTTSPGHFTNEELKPKVAGALPTLHAAEPM